MGEAERELPRLLLLGVGWFPPDAGGLNRYFRALLETLAGDAVPARAVVLGPAHDVAPRVVVAGQQSDPLPRRLGAYARVAGRLGRDADLVDAHFALYAFAPVVLGGLRRRPLVVHFHGPWTRESEAMDDRPLEVALKRLVERAVYRRARELVVLSSAFRRILVEQYGIRPWHVHVIPPGVDLKQFRPGDRAAARASLRLTESVPVAVTVRRLVPRVGVDVLLDAWATLDADALLAVAGDGPERGALERRAETLGLRDRVRFLGRVSDDELVRWYRAADVSVVPSTALEGFGLVALESLACGTPVVATDAGGLPEALAGLDTGLLVPAGDSGALAARLRAAFTGASPLPARDDCRRYAKRFTWARTGAETQRVYTAALRPPRRRTLRVVYVDHVARISGAEIALARLLPALENVEPHVVLAEDGPLAARLLRSGVSVEVLPAPPSVRDVRRDRVAPGRLPIRSACASAIYTARLARRLRALRPDLVHTWSLKAALYGTAAARLAGLPVVVHLHDRLADDYLPGPAAGLVRAVAKRLPVAVVATSEATRRTLGDAGSSAFVVHPPVEIDPRPRAAAGDFRVGVVGRIARWKGQDVFLKAFAAAFPSDGARATVVGGPLFGEESYERELRSLCSELGLDGRVELLGFREDVAAELARLDVLVHASVVPEPFGQVVVEAMAAGVPVVAADAGGPAEIVEEGVSGLLYEPGNVEALAARLRTLRDAPALRDALAEEGRRVAERFAPERVARELEDVYRRVCEVP